MKVIEDTKVQKLSKTPKFKSYI